MLEQYRGLRKENYILAFGRLVTGLGSMVWPMMTLILSQKMGVGAARVSTLLAAAMLIMAPAVYAGGRIADSCDKKMTIVVLDLISVFCFVTCAFIPLTWLAIGLMFIGSVCQNMENPAYNALTADITVTEDRDRSYSLQYLCANLGLVMSPTIAGILFNDHLWLVFLINGISIFCSAVLIYVLVRDTTPAEETSVKAEYQRDRSGEGVFRVLKDNPVIILFILTLSGYHAVYQLGYVYLMPLDLAAIHGAGGPVIYGTVTSINCVVVVAFTPVINRLFGAKPETKRITAGLVMMTGGFFLFVLFEKLIPVYYASMTVLTWGEIFAMTSESPYLSRRIPSSHRGRLNGVLTVVRTLTISAFQLLVGQVYAGAGHNAGWAAVLGAGCLCVLASLVMISADKRAYPKLYGKFSSARINIPESD